MSYQAPGPPTIEDLKMSSDTNMTNSYVQDWALSSTGTGMTPFLMGTEDITDPAETNPFETSFAPKSAQEASLLSANTAAANPPKRMLSPGAEQSTVKPDLKQLKRPQLNDLSRFDSSITQSTASKTSATAGSAQGTDASVSPASDVGYRASESDSDQVAGVSSRSSSSQARSSESSNTNARRPYQGFGSSFDVGGTEDISSQSFQDMIQGYASQSQYIQNMPRAMEAPPPFGPARAQTQPSPLSLPPGEVSSEQQPPSSKTTTEGEASPLNSNASEPAAPKKQLPARHSKRTKGTEAQAPHPPQPSHAQDQSKVNTARPPQPSNSRLQNKAEEKLDPEEVKRRQFLERNRVAACKSRQKKKEWVKQLESSAEELNTANSELQKVVHSQQEEIAYLRNLLASHDGCDCAEVSRIKQKLSGVSAPTPRQVGYVSPPTSSRHDPISSVAVSSADDASSANIPTSYPSPGSLVPGTAQAAAAQAQNQPKPQSRVQTLLDPLQQFTVEENSYSVVETSAPQPFDYFSTPSYNSLPFTTPDLVSELGYGTGQ